MAISIKIQNMSKSIHGMSPVDVTGHYDARSLSANSSPALIESHAAIG